MVLNRASTGLSNSLDVQFLLTLTSQSHVEGSYGGGLALTLVGTGFSDSSSVTICENSCSFVSSSASEYTCLVIHSFHFLLIGNVSLELTV